MADLTPVTRKEHFLSRAAGGPGLELEPITREEHFLEAIAEAGPSPGPGGEVTPASIVTATGQMSDAQKAGTRTNLNVVSNAVMGAVYERLEALEGTTVTVEGTDPTINPADNTIYNCGELTSLTITNPPASGAYSIVFTSGATATTTTIPATILGLEDFAPEANTMYEINVLDNRAVVGSWAVSA